MSSSDRVKYYYVKETALNAVPNNPAMKALRITGESLKSMFQNDQSKELRADRTEPEQIVVGANVGGDLNIEWLFDAHQDFLAAVCGQTGWTATGDPKVTTLVNGVAAPSFSIIKEFQDLAAVNHLYSGLFVNSFNLAIQKKSVLTGSFGLVGVSFNNGAIATLLPGVPVYTEATSTDPMNGSSHITGIKMNGVAMASSVERASIAIANNYRAKDALGSLNPVDYIQGRITVTGDMDLYFKTEAEFNLYKAGTAFAWEIDFKDNDNNQFNLLFDRCKFEDMEVVAGGTNQDIIAKGKWRALYNPGTSRLFQFTATTP